MPDDKLQLALNHALSEHRLALARQSLLGAGGLDQKRPQAWCEYGFPALIDFSDLYGAYSRQAIAFGAVNKLANTCWRTKPWVIEGDDKDNAEKETEWERSLKPTLTTSFWSAMREADKRRLVGRYAGLLLRVRDNGKWDQPVTRSAALEEIVPAWAGCLTPLEFDSNPNSQSYGKPKLWQYIEAGFNGAPGRNITVHPDRVFILGDWSADAIGFLEPAFNNLISLEKVEGGSGESYLKNSARQVVTNFDKEVDLQALASMYGVSVDELQTKFNDAARDLNRGNDVMLITQGATTTPLVASVPDPTPTYTINLQSAAAAWDIPTKILVGMQTGERASTEDQKYFNARCQSRREELTEEINALVRHLQRIKVVESVSEFTAMWDDLTEPTTADKLASAKTMSEINQVALGSGEPVFSREEVREQAGYENDELPDLGEDDDGQGANPSGQPD